jgi:ADP-L-glycero-D-manno-heptose 6-epimerase
MNIIITGTDGFIGGALQKKLSEKYEITTINEDIFNNTNWIKNLNKILEDTIPDGIFHVGACSDTLNNDVNYMMTRNYEFSKHISEYASLHDIPIIFSSSAANYGINKMYPSNLYGWSKYAAEQYIIQNGGVALRYFNVYGPGEEKKGKMASVAYQMMMKNKSGESVKLFPLKPKRDFVYIDDVISANIHAFDDFDEYHFNYYEVGYGVSRTFEDVLDILKINYTYLSENEIPSGYQFFTQSDKTKWLSNWKPKYDLESGLNDYLKKLNNNF